MKEINLIGGFYLSKSRPWSSQDVVNWIPVKSVVGGTRSPMKLRGVPGLKPLGGEVVESLRLVGFAPNGTVGSAYSFAYTAEGGTPPYTFSLVGGAVPDGLSFSAGSITGTPTTVQLSSLTPRVVDSKSQSNERPDNIQIFASAGTWIAFARSETNSIDVFASTANPLSWAGSSVGVTGSGLSKVEFCGVGGGVIIAGGGHSRVFVSTNGGTTWTNTTAPANASSGVQKAFYSSGRFLFSTPSAGMLYSDDNGASFTLSSRDTANLASAEGIARVESTLYGSISFIRTSFSTNNGTSWQEGGAVSGVGPRPMVSASGALIIAGGSSTNKARITRSTNLGGTWSTVLNPLTVDSTIPDRGIATDGNDSVVVINTEGQVMFSTNAGATWTLSSYSFGAGAEAVEYGGGKYVMAGENGKVAVSSDGGATWTDASVTTSFGGRTIKALAFIP